jgi:hypothetical protein
MCLFAEVHQEVACLLGGPRAGWMLRDSEDADAPGGVLNHGQDMAWVPSSRSAVNKSHARIASAWERRNCDQVGLYGARTPALALTWASTVCGSLVFVGAAAEGRAALDRLMEKSARIRRARRVGCQ